MNRADIKNFIVSNNLFLLPLQSIQDGKCTCNNITCASPGKHPLLKYSWKHVATNDPLRIDKWLNMKNINYGIATGRKLDDDQRLIVIDIDCVEHDFLDWLPQDTFHYRTGSGGWHFWFRTPYSVSNSASKIAPQVDVRGYGGYVVIPPSRHISGGTYIADYSNPIIEAPKKLLDLLFLKGKKVSNLQITGKVQNLNSGSIKKTNNIDHLSEWTKGSIGLIRKQLSENKYIPDGARNIVLHRLLSSDRAKGYNLNQLKQSAQVYRSQCQNSDNISDKELQTLIGQVIKYPTYNTSYEKVNEAYFDVMKRAGKPISLEQQELMKDLDNYFFKQLVNAKAGLSMHVLQAYREQIMQKHMKVYSKYPDHLFAAKLKSLGFERYRTSRGNFWNCIFSENS
jgi:hypothetical protein